MRRNRKPYYVIVATILTVAFITWVLQSRPESVTGAAVAPVQRIDGEPFMVECTAYCDVGITASGKRTVEGRTLAGAPEWMGCVALLYEVDEQGGIGKFIGQYEVTDTGYGRDGDIPRGETVDIYMADYERCMEWGRRDVYVQIICGRG